MPKIQENPTLHGISTLDCRWCSYNHILTCTYSRFCQNIEIPRSDLTFAPEDLIPMGGIPLQRIGAFRKAMNRWTLCFPLIRYSYNHRNWIGHEYERDFATPTCCAPGFFFNKKRSEFISRYPPKRFTPETDTHRESGRGSYYWSVLLTSITLNSVTWFPFFICHSKQ